MKVKYKLNSQKPQSHVIKEKHPARPKRAPDSKVYNDRIAVAARNKRLGDCLSILDSMKTLGIQPTRHTYCNIINGCVRCGDMVRAGSFHEEMLNKIGPCVEASTALLKGYFGTWDLRRAHDLFIELVETRVCVGERTLDTYVRGCLYSGDVRSLRRALTALPNVRSSATLEMLHKCLAMALVVPTAFDGYEDSSSASSHISAAKAKLLCGDFDGASKSLSRALQILSAAQARDIFDGHRISELRLEASALEVFLKKGYRSLTPKLGEILTVDGETKIHGQVPVGINIRNRITDISKSNSVFLEICSGSGDWVVSRAAENPNQVWMASEIRFDRCFDIAFKCMLSGIQNVTVCAGDANELLSLIPAATLQEVWINYPEPPAWHERSTDSQSDLVTTSFLENLVPRLGASGEIFVVSDNGNYMRTLLERFQTLSGLEHDLSTSKSNKSSYFDRMFSKGGKSERYILRTKRAYTYLCYSSIILNIKLNSLDIESLSDFRRQASISSNDFCISCGSSDLN